MRNETTIKVAKKYQSQVKSIKQLPASLGNGYMIEACEGYVFENGKKGISVSSQKLALQVIRNMGEVVENDSNNDIEKGNSNFVESNVNKTEKEPTAPTVVYSSEFRLKNGGISECLVYRYVTEDNIEMYYTQTFDTIDWKHVVHEVTNSIFSAYKNFEQLKLKYLKLGAMEVYKNASQIL